MPSLDPNIFGKFVEGKFLGGTIVDFVLNSSWNEQSYQINITIVEDLSDGDEFLLKDGEPSVEGGQIIGQCLSFQYGNFRFDGLLKSFDKSVGMDGDPIYHITLAPPNEILDACQVILNGYIGPSNDILFGGSIQPAATFSVSNLLNVYGWAEGGGADFGRSNVTDIGMPWTGPYGIQAGLQYLTSIPNPGPVKTNFGSHIIYKGMLYQLDLSGLPPPPSFYYLGGSTNMTLLELLSKFFEDAGCMYLTRLRINPNNTVGPHIISFIVVPRFVQQPLGKIVQYINGQTNINHSSHGQEIRSDHTQAFLVGGAQNILQPIQNNGLNLSIVPFWGFDFQGQPIIGIRPDGSQTADDNLQMNLNATSIADIMGELGYGLSYPCSILELRCALGNYDTWAAFIGVYKPVLAEKLRLYGAWQFGQGQTSTIFLQLMNVNIDYVNSLSQRFQDNHWPAVAQRLYEYVRGQADTYYGKKFIVQLPFNIQIKVDSTTAVVTLSNELCDAGYLPEGSQPLGLNYINENFFLDQTGRFYPFVRFSFYSLFNSVAGQKIVSPNVSYLRGTSAVTQYDPNPQYSYVYSRCEQGEDSPVYQNGVIGGGGQIFFVPNGILSVPAMVVTVPDAIWAQAEDIMGSQQDVLAIINAGRDLLQNISLERFQTMLSYSSTSTNLEIHPPAFYPDSIAVALKSNQLLYGPWGKFAADGKLSFEQDDGLVPWEYGGYTTLNQVAIAKLNTIAMGNQVLERGDIIEAGLPKISLGEQLAAEGPILTSIQCNIGVAQVTTTYTMETFVNRIGAFTIENAERLRRIGKIYQQLRRTMRQLILTNIQRSNTMIENYQGFMHGTAYAIQEKTPHAVLGGNLFIDDSGNYIPSSWTQTPQESLARLGTKNPQVFQSTACAGMEVLLRPYTNDAVSNDFLPFLVPPNDKYDTDKLVTGSGINPLRDGCDINWLISGNEYNGIRVSDGNVDFSTARSLALRGPVMICGYGLDIAGNPIPNNGQLVETEAGFTIDYTTPLASCNKGYINDYLKQSVNWPVGPLDLMFDSIRGMWVAPGMVLHGISSGTINPGSNGFMLLQIAGQQTDEILPVKNFYTDSNSTINDNTKIQACWNPLEKYWELTGAACSSN